MNNTGGNIPVALDPLSKSIGYRYIGPIKKSELVSFIYFQGVSLYFVPRDDDTKWGVLYPISFTFETTIRFEIGSILKYILLDK